MQLSLRKKFLLPTILLIMIGMSSVTTISYLRAREALRENMINQIRQQTESTAKFIDAWIADRKLMVESWTAQKIYQTAVQDTFVGKASRKPASDQLAQLKQEFQGYEEIHLATASGEIVASSNAELLENPINVSNAPYFQEVLQGNIVISNVMQDDIGKETGNPVLVIAAPLREADSIRGVLLGEIDLGYVNTQFIDAIKIGQSGYAYMYMADGMIIAYPDKAQILTLNIASYKFGQDMLKMGAGSLIYTFEGVEKLVWFQKIRETGWTIALGAVTQELFAPIQRIRNVNIVATLLLLLLSIIIILFVVRSTMQPIRRLALTANQLAKGDIGCTIPDLSTHDEIGSLVAAFRTMQDTIAKVLNETNSLIQAVQEGRLDSRGHAEAFAGSWRDLVVGLNKVIDAFVAPIAITARSLHQIAKGNIPTEITEVYQGDFNMIKESLNAMIANLRHFATTTRSTADQFTTCSQDLSSIAEGMSQGVSKQAASAEEVSATMEQMVANIRQSADNALRTGKIALKAADDARQGGQSVAEAVQSIQKIAAKISIIEEIALQTRMLSLNATIEAAKAQDYGKGFAVVAAEVRSLAAMSHEAAEEITELAAASVTMAETAGAMLQKLVPDIQHTAELVQEISATSHEQSIGVEQVNQAIQQLDQFIQQTADIAQQTAATAEELAGQAQSLRTTTAFFNITEPARSAADPQITEATGQRVAAPEPGWMQAALSRQELGRNPANVLEGAQVSVFSGKASPGK
jgi:methyl-accepting chemotaxis protein